VPGNNLQLTITNRHRLLRRGRAYQHEDEKGLLFISLCTDLERQFEFIQQSWLGAPGFAGLANEPDPIVSVKPAGSSARFTMPTSAGSLALEGGESFITVHGGGYFLLAQPVCTDVPGRSQSASGRECPISELNAGDKRWLRADAAVKYAKGAEATRQVDCEIPAIAVHTHGHCDAGGRRTMPSLRT
jgi:hypothetical protein